jgi:hypothetical protein
MKYQDPENIESVMKDILKLQTVKEVYDLLLTIYPDFVINVLSSYSKDYPHFDLNWRGMCETLKVQKAQIILVDQYPENDQHLLLKTFSEILTQAGFIIRKYTEFIPFSLCQAALQSEYIYNKLKENNIKTPEKWDIKCSTC